MHRGRRNPPNSTYQPSVTAPYGCTGEPESRGDGRRTTRTEAGAMNHGDGSVARRHTGQTSHTRVARRRSVLGAFLVLGGDRPFVPAISAAPSKGDGVPVDRRLRPHESSDAAFGAPVRKPKAQIHERGAQKRTSRPYGPAQPWACNASLSCAHRCLRCSVEVNRSEWESPSGEMRVRT